MALGAAPDAQDQPQTLIDHILERYHEVHRREFPQAIALARRVEEVHRDRTDCPRGLANHLAAMFEDLESHQQKEERMLFPMMRMGGPRMVGLPIPRMMLEHEAQVVQLDRLAEGKLSHQIAGELGISPKTVDVHRNRLKFKLLAKNVAHMTRLRLIVQLRPGLCQGGDDVERFSS